MTDGGRIEDIEATRDTAEVMIDIMTVAEDTDTEVEVMREIVITETDTEIDMRVDTAEIEIGIEEGETGMRGDMGAEKDTEVEVEKDMEVGKETEAKKEVEVILRRRMEDLIQEIVEKVHQLLIVKKGKMKKMDKLMMITKPLIRRRKQD